MSDDGWGELTLITDFAEVDLDSQVVNSVRGEEDVSPDQRVTPKPRYRYDAVL